MYVWVIDVTPPVEPIVPDKQLTSSLHILSCVEPKSQFVPDHRWNKVFVSYMVTKHIAGLVVNYGISNTIVLAMP